jgi:hypothetical protein
MVHTQNAVTSNQTLIQWLPKLTNISELLDAMADLKTIAPTEANPAKVCVAFQTRQFVTWHEEKMEMAGRTFEEAFAYENLAWCQDIKQKSLKLRVVRKKLSPPLAEVAQKIHDKVRGNNFNKTDFALALMMVELSEWKVPTYIAEGLQWLSEQLKVTDAFESLAGVASTKVEETS